MCRAGLLRREFGTTASAEEPFDRIFDQAVLVGGTGVVDEDAIGFAVRRAQPPANHLAEQPVMLGRAS